MQLLQANDHFELYLQGSHPRWYLRVKLKLASNYEQFNKLIPKNRKNFWISDVGMALSHICSSDRRRSYHLQGLTTILRRLQWQKNSFLKNDNIEFICSDIMAFPIDPHDAFVLSDVLHYIPLEDQERLLNLCIENLNPGGIVLNQDADITKTKEHKGTKLTEFFSTRILV